MFQRFSDSGLRWCTGNNLRFIKMRYTCDLYAVSPPPPPNPGVSEVNTNYFGEVTIPRARKKKKKIQ